jgi:hypothetical protein
MSASSCVKAHIAFQYHFRSYLSTKEVIHTKHCIVLATRFWRHSEWLLKMAETLQLEYSGIMAFPRLQSKNCLNSFD